MATRRINLLPPELAVRRRGRRVTTLLGMGGLALLALFILVYVVQVIRLNGEENRLEAVEARNGQLRQDVARLNEFDDLEEELERKTELLDQLTTQEVRWSVVLADVSLVIPSDVWLTSFSAGIGAGAGQEGEGEPEGEAAALGQIQMNGTTFSHTDVARWLTRLGSVDGFADPYLSLSSKASIGETPVVNFNSTVELGEKAFRRNQPGGRRPL